MTNKSKKIKIFVTSIIPEAGIKRLISKGIEIKQNMSYDIISKKDLIELAKDCEGMITLLSNKIDREVIDSLPKLKIIANCAVGFNNIDYKYAANKGIWVCNTPDVLTNATADLAVTLILTCSRRILEADLFVRSGLFRGWQTDLMLGKEISGKNVGIIGLGRIGKAFAQRLKGFNVNVNYFDINRDEEYEIKNDIKFQTFDKLIKNSDFISIHTPLNDKSRRLISEKEFNKMKEGVIIINTSRGEVIDEKSLYKYLKNGKVFSAGLDVYENEPKIFKKLMQLKNVVLLPHIGSATIETRNKMALIVTENIIDFSKGKKPVNRLIDVK